MMADSIKKQQHRDAALAALEDGQPLIHRPSGVESKPAHANRGSFAPVATPSQRRARRESRDSFKIMSMVPSLGVGITSLTFPGSTFPAGDLSHGQYGFYDDYNVANLRASYHPGAPRDNSPEPELYSDPSENKRSSRWSRRSYTEPMYRRNRASSMAPSRPNSFYPPKRSASSRQVPPSRPNSFYPPVRSASSRQVPTSRPNSFYPPVRSASSRQVPQSRPNSFYPPVRSAKPRQMPRQESFPARRPSVVSNGSTNSTNQTEESDRTDHTARRRRFHALMAKLAKLFGGH